MAQNETNKVGTVEDSTGRIALVPGGKTMPSTWSKCSIGSGQKRRTFLKIALVTFLIATVIAFLLPFRYTSTTSFVPPMMSSSSSMASMVVGQLSALGAGDLLGQKNPGELYSGDSQEPLHR